MKLRTLLLTCCIALALPGLAASALYAGSAWRALQQAHAAALGAQAAGDVMRAASMMMVERGYLQQAGYAAVQGREALMTARVDTDAALARARASLLKAGLHAEPVNLAREDLEHVRFKFDVASRTLASVAPLVEQLNRTADGLQQDVTRVERSVTFADASVGILVGLARTANEVRAAAGRRGVLLNLWFGGEALNAQQRDRLLLLTGRIAGDVDRLQGGLRTSGLAPTRIQAVSEMESSFLSESEPRYRAFVQAAVAGGEPPLDQARYRAWHVKALASLLPAREALLDEAAAQGGAAIGAARRGLLASAAVALVTVVLVAVTVTGLLRRLAAPVRAMTEAMSALAAGDLAAEPPRSTLREIGAMAAAVAVFRDNVGSLRRREAELGRTNVLFFAALENMSQGLTMYDADERLAVFNTRFCEITGLALDDVRVGLTYREVIALAVAVGHFPDRTVEDAYAASRDAIAATVGVGQADLTFEGRQVARRFTPLIGGGWVTTFEDVTERRDAEARIAHMAHHDALTGLANRVLFRDEMARALSRMRAGGSDGGELAVLCLDLDGFKAVNDTFGHPVGDALLRAVGRRLRGSTRETDVVARLGGDEFAVLQPFSHPPLPATALAERLVQAMREPFELGGRRVEVGVSVGVVLAVETSSPDDLLRDADVALYQAKSAGKRTWRLFDPRTSASVQERRRHACDLRASADQDAPAAADPPASGELPHEAAALEAEAAA